MIYNHLQNKFGLDFFLSKPSIISDIRYKAKNNSLANTDLNTTLVELIFLKRVVFKSVIANELFLALYLISEIIDGFDKKKSKPNLFCRWLYIIKLSLLLFAHWY
jgi:hypothetical protein